MIQTYHETKRYTNDTLDNSFFWFKNESYKNEMIHLGFSNLSSHPQYSLDGTTWQTPSWDGVEVEPNKKIYFRSADGFQAENEEIEIFSDTTGKWSVGGQIAALIDYTDIDNVTTIPDYCFYYFLERIKNYIIDYSKISFGNITTVGDYALRNCFDGVNTKGAPNMSGLTTVGEYGMAHCFSNTLLKEVDLSGLTTLDTGALQYCFEDSHITRMFLNGVTSLGNAALTCTFQNAWYLSEVYAPDVQTWDTNKTINWLSGAGSQVSGTKTVYAPTGVSIPTSESGIPDGWVREDY